MTESGFFAGGLGATTAGPLWWPPPELGAGDGGGGAGAGLTVMVCSAVAVDGPLQ